MPTATVARTSLEPDQASSDRAAAPAAPRSNPSLALAAAVLGFFIVTFDAVVVNVALPSIRQDFGAGITGLQWVVDGYTLMFAALLLWSGALTDRAGARRVFAAGIGLFIAASAACGLAPTLGALVFSRFVQGSAAAVMMPASMALIGHAYPDHRARAHAIAVWAMGGAIASSSGPVLGGVLTSISWRLIFVINVPIGAVALFLVRRIAPSPRRAVPFDWVGQTTAVTAMGALTYGAVEAGATGFGDPRVVLAFVLGAMAAGAFVTAQRRVDHPMVPLAMFRSRNVSVSVAVGFAFVVGYYGLPFVMSLYLQELRGLSAFDTGCVFLPMMVTGAVLTPFSARVAERIGSRSVVSAGLAVMAVGLAVIAGAPASTPVWALALLMVLVGIAGPLTIPPVTALLLNSVPGHQAGTASGVFNTSRQIGGALAVAVFGALLSGKGGLVHGLRVSLRVSLLVAAVIAVAAGAASLLIQPIALQRKDL
jgi:DHA2 family methylenomycin A resistance protein-like MFS transporter